MAENEAKDETKEIDLEQCVNKDFAHIRPLECDECDGFNYNCVSYYPLGQYNDLMRKASGVWKKYISQRS